MDINLKQNITQKISQKMLQYINILQMNHQELTDYIEQFSLDNPFIDICSNIKDSISNVQIDELNNLSVINYETFNYSGTDEYDSFENLSLPHEETLVQIGVSCQKLFGSKVKREFSDVVKRVDDVVHSSVVFVLEEGCVRLGGVFGFKIAKCFRNEQAKV